MRCLIIKTSSLGDVIHMLPALTEAKKQLPQMTFDWVVEQPFAEIPEWHPAVDKIFTVNIRTWRKNLIKHCREIYQFRKDLRKATYDYIIDAQGLLKTAWITKFAKGISYGFDKNSAREGLSSIFYQHKITVEKSRHAIYRLQLLLAKTFNYSSNVSVIDYGICYHWRQAEHKNQVVFLAGTTWASKHWPLKHWQQLAHYFCEQNCHVLLPWGNEKEKLSAKEIGYHCKNASILPEKKSLFALLEIFTQSKAVIAVDTGLAHLAAACNVPSVTIYESTAPKLTGTKGNNAVHIASVIPCAPCLKRNCPISQEIFAPCGVSISAQSVFNRVNALLSQH